MTAGGIRNSGRVKLEASLWSADPSDRTADLADLAHLAEWVHIDVGDGDFAPELFSPEALEGVTLPAHVHIMARRSLPLAQMWARAGAHLISVHAEAEDPIETIAAIRDHGQAAGLALTLDSAPDVIVPYLDEVAAIVMVGTPIGTRGTSMDPAAPDRIRTVRALLDAHPRGNSVRLIADGGIRADTVRRLVDAGADALVAGSLLFAAADRRATAAWMRGGGHGPCPGQPSPGAVT